MAERIIPIKVEGRDEPYIETDNVQTELSKSLEELNMETTPKDQPSTSKTPQSHMKATGKEKTLKVVIKPAPVPINKEHEYLKEFDVFEKRDENNIVSGFTYPSANVQERIVLVIDRAQDDNYTPFTVGNQKYTPLTTIKRALSIFIKLKLTINPRHQFAIITMNEKNATKVQDFCSDFKKLNESLNKITECQTEDIFDLNTVFDLIQDELPAVGAFELGLTTPYVLRTILCYGRSYTIPEIKITEKLDTFFKHPFSICDILMTHEPIEISNHCQKIFDVLQTLDQKGISYFFPVGRDTKRMHRCSGKLLGHPFQRPIQKLIKN